jgi:hypothetical protein
MRTDYCIQSEIQQGVCRAARHGHSSAKNGASSYHIAWFATTHEARERKIERAAQGNVQPTPQNRIKFQKRSHAIITCSHWVLVQEEKKIGASYRTSLRSSFKEKSLGEEVESDTRTTQNYFVFIMVDFAAKKIFRHVLPSRPAVSISLSDIKTRCYISSYAKFILPNIFRLVYFYLR